MLETGYYDTLEGASLDSCDLSYAQHEISDESQPFVSPKRKAGRNTDGTLRTASNRTKQFQKNAKGKTNDATLRTPLQNTFPYNDDYLELVRGLHCRVHADLFSVEVHFLLLNKSTTRCETTNLQKRTTDHECLQRQQRRKIPGQTSERFLYSRKRYGQIVRGGQAVEHKSFLDVVPRFDHISPDPPIPPSRPESIISCNH